MTGLTVRSSADAADARAREAIFADAQAVSEAALMDAWGLPELAVTAAERQARLADPDRDVDVLVADDEAGAPVACASIELPLRENLSTADISVLVDPHHPDAEAAYALLADAVDARLAAAGRTTRLLFAEHPDHPEPASAAADPAATPGQPASADDPASARPLLPCASGHGALFADDPEVRRLTGRGFELVQVEVFSVLPLDDSAPPADLPDGITARSWAGSAPADLRDAVCALLTEFSETVPDGAAEVEKENWDESRLASREARASASGFLTVGTVLLEEGSAPHERSPEQSPSLRPAPDAAAPARPVAMTIFEICEGREFGYQEETVTVRTARGRGLATAAKRINAAHLRTVRPDSERVYTWNAVENAPMRAINRSAGFCELGAVGLWQKRTAEAGSSECAGSPASR